MPDSRTLKTPRRLAALALGAVLLLGCASFEDRMAPADEAFAAGDYARAAGLLEALKKDDARNAHLYALNLGVDRLALGQPKAALRELRFARDRLDDLAAADYATWFGAVLTDDRTLDYGGEDYEQILVRAMLAIADLMSGGGDADAFAEQVLQRQLEIRESFTDDQGKKPKLAYRLVAFGSYLRGILNEDRPLSVDVARREFAKVVQLAPAFPYGPADLERVTRGRFAARGHGVVHVLALVGRGPYKVEVEEPVTGQALAIAQVAWNLHRKRITFPNLTAIRVPALAHHPDNPTEAVVEADGRTVGRTATVTDVDATAREQFEVMKPWIVGRAVLRRVFKLAAVEAAKEIGRRKRAEGRPLLDLGLDLAGILWTAAERADTRGWTLLPARFQALRVELPAGEHTLSVYAGRGGRKVGPPQTVRVRVRDGFSTFVVALVPTLDGGPPPLTSDAAARDEPGTARREERIPAARTPAGVRGARRDPESETE